MYQKLLCKVCSVDKSMTNKRKTEVTLISKPNYPYISMSRKGLGSMRNGKAITLFSSKDRL